MSLEKPKTSLPKDKVAEIEGKDFFNPDNLDLRGIEHVESLRWAIGAILNGEAEVEVEKTENGKFLSLSIFKIDRETNRRLDLLVSLDNIGGTIGPLLNELGNLGIEAKYIIKQE